MWASSPFVPLRDFFQDKVARYVSQGSADWLDLDTSAIYWSMLETGLGFVAANLVVVYGLLAHSKLVSYLRSLGSTLFSKFSRVESQEDNAFRSQGVNLQGLNSANTSTYGQHDGRDIEDIPLGDFQIHVEKGFGSTVV